MAPESRDASTCVAAIAEACKEAGFFIVVGHGIADHLDTAFSATEAFFALPQQDKEAVPRLDRYGYVPHAHEAIDTHRASDRTEFMDIGLGDEVPLSGLVEFESAVRTYQAAVLRIATTLLRAIALGLDIEPDFFASRMTNPQCRLRILHYPPTPVEADGSLPVLNQPHTDYGAITLLATDGVPGLEVRHREAGWAPVNPPLHSLTVNLGDMLARWTNDRYKSTAHRVIGSPSQDRFSIPFFVNPDPSTVVSCIPSCVSTGNPCRYEPVTAGGFLASRIDQTSEPYVSPLEGPQRR